MTSLIFTEGSQGTLCSTDALPPVGKCLGGTCLFSGERDEDMNITPGVTAVVLKRGTQDMHSRGAPYMTGPQCREDNFFLKTKTSGLPCSLHFARHVTIKQRL